MEVDFEKVSRLKLRFETSLGLLSTEDLWDLSLTKLNVIAKSLNKAVKEVAEEDFLDEKSMVDTILQLKFDIVVYILGVKKEEKKVRDNAKANKEKNQKILAIIERKDNEEMEGMSKEDLMKMLT